MKKFRKLCFLGTGVLCWGDLRVGPPIYNFLQKDTSVFTFTLLSGDLCTGSPPYTPPKITVTEERLSLKG